MKPEMKEDIYNLYNNDETIAGIRKFIKDKYNITISPNEIYAVIPDDLRRRKLTNITPDILSQVNDLRKTGLGPVRIKRQLETKGINIGITSIEKIIYPDTYKFLERQKLERKRKRFQKEFDRFMNRDEFDLNNCWSPEDDELLKKISITYIEFVTGIGGEPVLDEILKAAKILGSALWSKLGKFLEDQGLDLT